MGVASTTLLGDCRAVLTTLPDASYQCCVTSPPYWGLRDYGTARWEGGNDENCTHGVTRWDGPKQTQGAQSSHSSKSNRLGRMVCGSCGARRVDGQIGLEGTPAEYVETLVSVFREVRRVLAEDGTCWLNLGDSYCGIPGGFQGKNGSRASRTFTAKTDFAKSGDGLKPKDLVGIPWRVAFALQADGWYLRSDIIWSKPNSMPESVADRPTNTHEHVFLLSKSERYFYDQDAIREPHSEESLARVARGRSDNHKFADGGPRNQTIAKDITNACHPNGRNARSVWTIACQPSSEAHFAVYPPELPRRCILAGSRPGDSVLDPFGGSGTTGRVAVQLGRNATMIELSAEYAKLADERTLQTGLGI